MNPIQKFSTPCVILAGGKSSRMGKNKALLPFGGYSSLAEYQYRRLQEIFESVYISTKDSSIFEFEAEFIEDDSETSAPGVAINTLFNELYAHEIFLITVDAPFVSFKTIGEILERGKEGHEAVLAKTPAKKHYLIGLYKESILPRLEELLEEKNYKLSALVESSETLFVDFLDEEEFSNLNTKEEYQAALAKLPSRVK